MEKKCLICGRPTADPTHKYCQRCLHSSIKELERRLEEKEGPVSTREDVDQALVSEPVAENTHR